MEYNGLCKSILLLKLKNGEYVPLASVLPSYGPFSSLNEALNDLADTFKGIENVPRGYTFCLIENGKPQEYWFTKEGDRNSIEKKNTSSSSSSSGISDVVATVDNKTGTPSVNVSLSKKVLRLDFHNLKGEPGKDGKDGESGGGGGAAGRSVTSIDMWFKLSDSTQVSAPDLSIADPSTSAGGSWSLASSNPSASLPYLWAFMQINYDKALSSGYTYSRSSAYIARRYNVDTSTDYSDLETLIQNIRSDMESELEGYENDLKDLNDSLEALRTSIQETIVSDITALQNRLDRINGTDVERIMNNEEGLWGVLTSYEDDTKGQKSFSDIVLDAKRAKNTLSVGSQFFGERTGAEITLDGIKGLIALKATQDDIDSAIAQAQFSVDPAALKSVISKGQKCWKKGNLLYPYDLYLSSFEGTISEYETYMASSPEDGGPEGDDVNPAGPFTLAVTVNQFSVIQQTVDEFSSSIDTFRYMWTKDDEIYSYDYFKETWENRPATYQDYTYEDYVTRVLNATKVEVSNVLSNFTQSSNEIRSTIGDMGYIWRKQNQDGTYSYQRYAVPSNKTRDTYVSEMEDAGWELYDFAAEMTVIDQTPDDITLAVKKARLVWINSNLPADNSEYCVEYDYWYDDYITAKTSASYTGTYEQFVASRHPRYALEHISSGMSRLKQTENAITSAVSRVDALDTNVSSIAQTAEGLSAQVGKTYKGWKNSEEDIKPYAYFEEEWENSGSPLGYESWVESEKHYNLTEISSELSNIKVQSDKIWAGVNDGNGNVAAAISILKELGVNSGKIVLSANKVEIDGNLFSRFISTNPDNSTRVEIEDGLITIYDANNVKRIVIGQETGDSNPVLRFYNASGNELYNLGPDGIKQFDSVATMPHWTSVPFYKFNNLSEGDSYSQGSGTRVILFQYADAMKLITVGGVNVVQYYNPDTDSYSSSTTKYNNMYFAGGLFEVPEDGYYVIVNYLWNKSSSTAARAKALRVQTVSGVKHYYYGFIELKNIDQDAGTTGTIDEMKINTEFV